MKAIEKRSKTKMYDVEAIGEQSDTGHVVFDTTDGTYWTGLGWSKQLRDAKIYRSTTYAMAVGANHTKHPDQVTLLKAKIEIV